jgi:hypothetical protein
MLRDRDRIFGHDFVEHVRSMGIKQMLSAPRSPWQRAYIERVLGTIRRECLDHTMVFDERSLRFHLCSFSRCCHRTRTHLALQNNTPDPRPVQPPESGPIISILEVGRVPSSLRAPSRQSRACFRRKLCNSAILELTTYME